jgi:hypothetical protein
MRIIHLPTISRHIKYKLDSIISNAWLKVQMVADESRELIRNGWASDITDAQEINRKLSATYIALAMELMQAHERIYLIINNE